MQTSGQFGVPPAEVNPHYNSVNNTMNNNNSNTSTNRSTSTPGSNQALGHLLFNFPTSHDQPAPLSSPRAHNPLSTHSQPTPPVLLGKAGTDRDGTAELFQESNPTRQPPPPPQQQQQNPQFAHFLQSTASASAPEHFQATENAHQEQMGQQKLGPGQGGDKAQAQMHHQLSLGIDQGYGEGGNNGKGNEINQQVGADPISLGDIDQAEEGTGAGNRWPRQETLALLKIRADMDASFRDTSVKRPLWDEVSRKMGELGYERSAKKCKEKFENVNKYYKRTKEGKVGRQDGKNYRFFTQLEALSTNHHHNNNNNSNPNNNNNNNSIISNNININHNSSITHLSPGSMLITSTIDTISKFKAAASDAPLLPSSALPVDHNLRTSDPGLLFPPSASASAPPPPHQLMDPVFRPPPFPAPAATTLQLSSPSSCDDDDDDDDDDDSDDEDDDHGDDDNADDDYDNPQPRSHLPHNPVQTDQSKKRKRKASTSMMAFFEGLLKKVIDKQEQMQQKFLQALEKRESDRLIREEAWRRQEIARLSKEHELRAQERSSAAARDAALITFLQKVTGQTVDLPTVPTSMPIAAQPVQCAPPLHQENTTIQQHYEDHDPSDPNSKRWLKPEVLALIDLHSSLQAKFTEAGPKGHLWEEIANGMAKLGYSSRTAKRCKEKWENINKYFKRAKESNKKRPENAKTCPYFHELDALYRKGLLGSSSLNQLPYKPSIEHAQPQNDDVDSVVHQPSSTSINTGEGTDGMDFDCARNLQAQPPTISHAPSDRAVGLDAIASITTNVSVVGGGNANNCIISDAGMRIANNNGGVQSKGSSMQRLADAVHSAPGMNASTTLDRNVNSSARSGFTAELGLNSQQQSASMDLYQHKQMNQSDFGKVNAGGEQESQVQSGLKDSKPSVLAPLPNSSSFMSNMLQKMNSNSTVVNNITTNQDQ